MQDASRVCTDKVCIIFGLAFILVLFIITFSLYDEGNPYSYLETYLKSSFPTDSDGRLCGNELINFPYVYFVSLPDISKRVCVSSCPSSEDTKLNCFMTKSIGCRFSQTPGFEVRYYNNEPF